MGYQPNVGGGVSEMLLSPDKAKDKNWWEAHNSNAS